MITIYKPEIVRLENGVRLQAKFNINGKENFLWYEVDERYHEYLTIERTDAFLVGLFLLGIKNNMDIKVEGPVSTKLFYTLNIYLLPLLGEIRGERPIKIFCNNLVSDPIESAGAIGTGLSCGIDSFSTIYSHLGEDSPEDYKITHFTFFNVGSNGTLGGEKARKLFHKRLALVTPCAEELGKELITVDSNINEILQWTFNETHTYRNISASLVLQKLFKAYYYSSSYSIKYFDLKPKSCGHFDIFNMSMLSTENISFYSSCPHQTRVEKTKMVSQFEPARRYLNVCITDGSNCGGCEKCVRTLFTLELLGQLEHFSSVFNLSNYYSKRSKYIAKVLAYKEENEYMKEIYDELKKENFKIPTYSKAASQFLKLRKIIN